MLPHTLHEFNVNACGVFSAKFEYLVFILRMNFIKTNVCNFNKQSFACTLVTPLYHHYRTFRISGRKTESSDCHRPPMKLVLHQKSALYRVSERKSEREREGG